MTSTAFRLLRTGPAEADHFAGVGDSYFDTYDDPLDISYTYCTPHIEIPAKLVYQHGISGERTPRL